MGTVCHASENSMRELKTLNITDKIDTVVISPMDP